MFEVAITEVRSKEAVREIRNAEIAIKRMAEIIKGDDYSKGDCLLVFVGQQNDYIEPGDVVLPKFVEYTLLKNNDKGRGESGFKHIYRNGATWRIVDWVDGKVKYIRSAKNLKEAVKLRDEYFKNKKVNK